LCIRNRENQHHRTINDGGAAMTLRADRWRVREVSPGSALLLAANTPENRPKLIAAVARIDEAGVEALDPALAPVLDAARAYLQAPGTVQEAALTQALQAVVQGSCSQPRSVWPAPEQWWQA
jgi:sugar/nucleoside kinase (ribokinase family)